MAFEYHSDALDHIGDSEAVGLWVFGGNWTDRHGRSGVLTDAGVAECRGTPEAIAVLVTKGMWTRVEGGYRYDRGPSTDWPLPLWRYSDAPSDGRLITVIPDPDR